MALPKYTITQTQAFGSGIVLGGGEGSAADDLEAALRTIAKNIVLTDDSTPDSENSGDADIKITFKERTVVNGGIGVSAHGSDNSSVKVITLMLYDRLDGTIIAEE
ncbi:MAG: hypothetical protein JW713_05865 [Pontiellaceae bacterium]|nr:hypothetical protein [Pontiellaceae bacterium]